MKKKISLFAGNGCAKEKEAEYFSMAHRMGTLLAENDFVTVTGAGAGLMEEAMRGAFEAGGETAGVVLNFKGRKPSRYLKDSTVFDTLAPRQDKLVKDGDAYIALPGGVGTFYEIFNILAFKRLNEIPHKKPFILVGAYYNMFEDMLKKMQSEGFVEKEIFSYYDRAETPEEALTILKRKILM